MENNLIAEIEFSVNAEKLVIDMKNFRSGIAGFDDYKIGYGTANWEDKVIGDKDRTNSGFIPPSRTTPEIKRIVNYFTDLLGVNVYPIFTTQRPNKELFMHQDPKEMKCAINFVIYGNESPITFKDAGDFYYKHALVNVSKMHAVRAQRQKRILFKLCINDLTFEETKEKLKDILK